METSDVDPDLQNESKVDDYLVVFTTFLSVVFFVIVNEVLKYVSQRYVILKMTSQWRWRNLAVSWIHADLCAVGCVYCYVVYGQHLQTLSALMDLQPLPAYILVAFSTGYFLYDMLDHAWNGQMRAQWEVIAHHIAVICIFGYNLGYHLYLAFSVLALMVEINSVFLHGRKLLQMLHVPFSHWLYRATVALNLVSFLVFRCLPLVLIWAGIIFRPHRLSWVYLVMLSSVMVFMVVLNPMLFWRLVKNDLLRRNWQTKEEGAARNEEDRGISEDDDGRRNAQGLTPEPEGVQQNGGLEGWLGMVRGGSLRSRGGQFFTG